jgi:hypothetical protein
MMKNMQKFLLFVAFLGIVCTTFGPAMAAESVLGEVTLNPEHPTKLSTITFTASVIGEDIKIVKIIVLECNATTGVCQNTRDNKTMQHIGGSLFEANITLDYAPASYITYWVYVESNSGETVLLPDTHGVKLNLSVSSTNGSSGDGNNSGNGKTPGFEVVLFIAAVCSALILVGRKRFR